MSEPFIAEIRMVGFNFAPRGWAFCDGQILPIAQNQSLYSLLGTTYGGDGRTSFALPDLRGRSPIHVSDSHPQGQKSGTETHTLSTSEMPAHSHTLRASTTGADRAAPSGLALSTPGNPIYHEASNLGAMNATAVTHSGGGQAINLMQPYLAVNFCIALQGLFPSHN